jgi:hypothetical protein
MYRHGLVGSVRQDDIGPRELTLPPDHAAPHADLKDQVRTAQVRAHRVVNTEVLSLYWQIGDAIRARRARTHRRGPVDRGERRVPPGG